jgi:hypothetical protein
MPERARAGARSQATTICRPFPNMYKRGKGGIFVPLTNGGIGRRMIANGLGSGGWQMGPHSPAPVPEGERGRRGAFGTIRIVFSATLLSPLPVARGGVGGEDQTAGIFVPAAIGLRMNSRLEACGHNVRLRGQKT